MKEDAGKDKCFFVGEVVWVPLSDFDKAKVDNQCLTGVIVKINQAIFKARILVKARLLKAWYNYFKLSCVCGPGNNMKLLGLNEAFLIGKQ